MTAMRVTSCCYSSSQYLPLWQRLLLSLLCVLLAIPPVDASLLAQSPEATGDSTVYLEEKVLVPVPGAEVISQGDSVLTVVEDSNNPYLLNGKKEFNPDPTKAVWMSALFPGLGQVYNRRYWKLPIVVGGFMGLGYATSWNNKMLNDYTQAYRDLTDSDPGTDSYMNFFPPTTNESDIDKTWLTSVMRSRRDYYRRNRDLCIIFVVGLYLLCMVDAYVDASLAHFDISDNLSMDVTPTMLGSPVPSKPAFGLNWAFTF